MCFLSNTHLVNLAEEKESSLIFIYVFIYLFSDNISRECEDTLPSFSLVPTLTLSLWVMFWTTFFVFRETMELGYMQFESTKRSFSGYYTQNIAHISKLLNCSPDRWVGKDELCPILDWDSCQYCWVAVFWLSPIWGGRTGYNLNVSIFSLESLSY